MKTGNTVQAHSNNGLTWNIKGMIPVLAWDEKGLYETGDYEPGENTIPYEKFIERYRPMDARGKAFVIWCMTQIAEGLKQKLDTVELYIKSFE